MRELLHLPHFSEAGRTSYLDMYFSILDRDDVDIDGIKDLIDWEIGEIRYRFHLDGLRRAVIGELLDQLGNISNSELLNAFNNDNNEHYEQFYHLLRYINQEWTPEIKYSHEHY
ncbi:hypothetical protein [Chryseobacterium limigenitum]|uniref:Uncharacterized protein n=1 Tax=Chryseobacterium limigenitum TaxID=1612149 RepID=A0A1K2IFK9_9FLAO|nr:hypothetical protein [Chryseobacterium limigenitum]SFZ91042.1 hypothetical protein SAMN05216324_10218 [Chryseobacterium limigenitum]